MSDQPTRTGEHPATNLDLKATELTLSVRSVLQGLVALGAMLSVVFGGYFALIGRVEAATDAGIERLTPRIAELEARAKRDEDTINAVRLDVREVQADVRELYRVIQTGARSARLEAPLPAADGGAQ